MKLAIFGSLFTGAFPLTSPVLKARADLGVAHRAGDTASITTARRDLAAEKIAQYVERTVSSAPPLTDEQRDRIAALLRPVGGAA